MTILCLAGNCLLCVTTFLLGSAKADAQNATDSVTAVHRANQPNLFSVFMSPFCSFFRPRQEKPPAKEATKSAGAAPWKGTDPTQLDPNLIDVSSTLEKRNSFGSQRFRDSSPATTE